MGRCDVCKEERPVHLRLIRRFPQYDAAGLCLPCSQRVTRQANDRGPEIEESGRLAAVYRRLAGEVWTDDRSVFWFERPFLHRDTKKNEVKAPKDLARLLASAGKRPR